MIFERKKYLNELIAGRGNGLVKIITGVRRCGKSFLLFDIWHNWLLEHEGVSKRCILFFYKQNPDFHKPGLCHVQKNLYL